MSYKRDLVLKTFNNEETDRAPIGFWYHFAKDETVPLTDELVKINYNGHLKFCKDVEPDFLKIMSDGFFHYPGVASEPVTCAADLKKIKSGKPETLAWIDRQIDMVKKVASQYGKDMVTLYNVFSPASYLTFATENLSFKNINSFYEEDPEALKNALLTIAEDVKILADRAIREAGVDGIYFSVGCYDGISREEYQRIIEPSELAVLEVANAANDCNMIHICGYAGRKNDLTTFKDYPVKAVNWATVVEGIPLEEGRKIFGNRAVAGGFANTTDGVLYSGTEEQIKAETKRILSAAGSRGVILGADCTIPRGTPASHIQWVREAAEEFGKG